MAKIKLKNNIFSDFSGGYASEQAYMTEERVSFIGDSKNIDIFPTSHNDGYGFKKALGNKVLIQIQGQKIKGLYSYNYQKDTDYLLIHTVNDTDGKLYYMDSMGEIHLLKEGLNKDATNSGFVNFSQTLPSKRYLGIFGNGVDKFIKIELAGNPQVEEITATDSENRDLRSSILETYFGRVWCGVDDRVHWSKSLDPFTWSTTAEDAGWQQLDSDIVSITSYSGGLVISTKKSIYYCTKDTTGFVFTTISPNHAVSSKAMIKHDNYALYMADDGIYPINVTQEDTKKVDEDVSWLLNKYLQNRDKYNYDNMFALSVTSKERNEVWFHVPMYASNKSCIFIYRFITGRQKHLYWLPPRIEQKINCLIDFDNMILSGTDDGKILMELSGKTFDGATIESIAEFPELDFNGTYNKQKFKLFIYSELEEDNKFYVDYFFNGENEYDRQEIILSNTSFKWDEGNWDEVKWAADVMLEYQLDKPRKHNKLKLRFVADEAGQDFVINSIVTTRVKVKNK